MSLTEMGSWHMLIQNTSFSKLRPIIGNMTIINACWQQKTEVYSRFFGATLAMPEWEALITSLLLSVIIVLTIVGNILVILSVFTYKPLRIAQNFFIVSLAVADLAVALLVLPFNVAYSILGRWEFGIHLCKLWLTFDVMCCTSSILNLCAIALDRFWAITDPINYAHKRTITRVLFLISGVWIMSFLISSPPLFGWNDWPSKFTSTTPCELTSNPGYVIYSALGSFFIPLVIMTVVYFEIYIATKRRLRERRLAASVPKLAFNKADASANKVEVSLHGNTESSTWFVRYLCCNKKSRILTTSTVQDEKESCSSDTPMKSDTHNESQTTKSFEKRVFENSLCFENRDSLKKLETCTAMIQRTDSSESKNLSTENSARLVTDPSDKEKDDKENECFKSQKKCNFLTQERSAFNVQVAKECTRVYQFVEERQKISLSKERRAARTLGIIMGVFVVCWLPFFLMYVTLPFCKTCCPTQKLKNFITWLGYINSSLNPLIYTIFNLDYRNSFKRLLGLK